MSPTQQEIAAKPTLHTNQFTVTDAHTAARTHFCKIQCSIHQLCDFLPDTKAQKQLSSCLLVEPVCMALLSLSDCVQEDKAKTGGVTASTAPDQGADRADKGSLAVTLSSALQALAETVSSPQKICSDDSRVTW